MVSYMVGHSIGKIKNKQKTLKTQEGQMLRLVIRMKFTSTPRQNYYQLPER